LVWPIHPEKTCSDLDADIVSVVGLDVGPDDVNKCKGKLMGAVKVGWTIPSGQSGDMFDMAKYGQFVNVITHSAFLREPISAKGARSLWTMTEELANKIQEVGFEEPLNWQEGAEKVFPRPPAAKVVADRIVEAETMSSRKKRKTSKPPFLPLGSLVGTAYGDMDTLPTQLATLPPGPQIIAELLAWPKHMIGILMKSSDRARNLNWHLKNTVYARSHYSGMLTPEVGHAFGVQSCKDLGVLSEGEGISTLHTADNARECQIVGTHWDGPGGPDHVFGAFQERMPRNVLNHLRVLRPRHNWWKTDDVEEFAVRKLAAINAYKKMHTIIRSENSRLFNEKTRSYCHLHQRDCRCCLRRPEQVDRCISRRCLYAF
jgi:hypothetical protein